MTSLKYFKFNCINKFELIYKVFDLGQTAIQWKTVMIQNLYYKQIFNIMKSKQSSPAIWLFNRHDKQQLGSHHSGSTFQASDNQINTKNNQLYADAEPISRVNLAKGQAETVSFLRKELKNIKLQVTKLIEEGFVKTQVPSQWLESSGNMSSISKASKMSSIMNNDFYTNSEGKNRRIEQSLSNSLEELNILREQHQKLKLLCIMKEQRQAQIIIKQKQLNQEVKALRKNKQQLTKCIQILQVSLRDTNEQLKYYIGEVKKLQQEIIRCRQDIGMRQQDIGNLNFGNKRLQEQLQYRKAENNELIRIIQRNECQFEQLKINYSSQIRAMEMQHQRVIGSMQTRNFGDDCFERGRRAKSIDSWQQNSIRKSELQKLLKQNDDLRKQLGNKQQVMAMMLKDIKQMDRQLRDTDIQHQELLRCRKLIQSLNELITRTEAIKLSTKYKYY